MARVAIARPVVAIAKPPVATANTLEAVVETGETMLQSPILCCALQEISDQLPHKVVPAPVLMLARAAVADKLSF